MLMCWFCAALGHSLVCVLRLLASSRVPLISYLYLLCLQNAFISFKVRSVDVASSVTR